MKKTLAMLLALMLALGAMGSVAFAEEREPLFLYDVFQHSG